MRNISYQSLSAIKYQDALVGIVQLNDPQGANFCSSLLILKNEKQRLA